MQGTRGHSLFNGIITHHPVDARILTGTFSILLNSLILQWPLTQAQVTNTTVTLTVCVRGETHAFFINVFSLSHLGFWFSAANSYKHTYATEGDYQ